MDVLQVNAGFDEIEYGLTYPAGGRTRMPAGRRMEFSPTELSACDPHLTQTMIKCLYIQEGWVYPAFRVSSQHSIQIS